ncbi:MAG: phosphotransferase, partial [Deltaproteobacteria bacterium]|nr:phosphotransferase [Deltaproteobacteria bacterium]
MKELVGRLLQRFSGITANVRDLTKLHGDASYRTYFRATLDDGQTFIVMQMPEGKSSASEEITNFKGTLPELPFINVARYLASRGLPVPQVIGHDESSRLMII